MSDIDVSNDEEIYLDSYNNFDKDRDSDNDIENVLKNKIVKKKNIKIQKYKSKEKEDVKSEEDDEQKEEIQEDNYEDDEDDEYGLDNIYNIKSPEYLKYKKNILGSDKPIYSDKELDYYYISGSKNVKKFINIKTYGNNLEIVNEHVEQIAHNLEIDENPKLYSHLTIIEYCNYNTDTEKNILEIIDGHHRILALQSIFKRKPNFEIGIRINLIRSDFPDSPKTNIIFRKFNIIKPFIVDFDILETTETIIKVLNSKFSNDNFEFIKNTAVKIRRPIIKHSEIHGYIQQRLNELKITKKINYNDISIENIITEFEKLNNIFSEKSIFWINNDKTFKNNLKSTVTENMFKRASKYNCFIGLVNLKVLVEKCITYKI